MTRAVSAAINKMAAYALFTKNTCTCISQIPTFINYSRSVSTSAALFGKRNFRKFLTYNKRGSLQFKRDVGPVPLHDLGVRRIGVIKNKRFVIIPEMIPALIVPDLTGFQLKPYVSYRVPDVVQSEFTARDLFDACYADKIVDDFKKGKLDENRDSTEPSPTEALKPEEAYIKARQTGCDLFIEKLDVKIA